MIPGRGNGPGNGPVLSVRAARHQYAVAALNRVTLTPNGAVADPGHPVIPGAGSQQSRVVVFELHGGSPHRLGNAFDGDVVVESLQKIGLPIGDLRGNEGKVSVAEVHSHRDTFRGGELHDDALGGEAASGQPGNDMPASSWKDCVLHAEVPAGDPAHLRGVANSAGPRLPVERVVDAEGDLEGGRRGGVRRHADESKCGSDQKGAACAHE